MSARRYAAAIGIPFAVAGIGAVLLVAAGGSWTGLGSISAIEVVIFVLVIGSLFDTWPAGMLAPGLSPAEAADVAWSIEGDESYHGLVVDRGWSPERWEAWLGETLVRLLLAT